MDKRRKYRLRILMLLVLLLVGGGVLLFVFMPREPLLLLRATRCLRRTHGCIG